MLPALTGVRAAWTEPHAHKRLDYHAFHLSLQLHTRGTSLYHRMSTPRAALRLERCPGSGYSDLTDHVMMAVLKAWLALDQCKKFVCKTMRHSP
jgi:hypothetical protein